MWALARSEYFVLLGHLVSQAGLRHLHKSRRHMVRDSGLRRCRCCRALPPGSTDLMHWACQKRKPRTDDLSSRQRTRWMALVEFLQHHYDSESVLRLPRPQHRHRLRDDRSSEGQQNNRRTRRPVSLCSRYHQAGCYSPTWPFHCFLDHSNQASWRLCGWKRWLPIPDIRCCHLVALTDCRYMHRPRPRVWDRCSG